MRDARHGRRKALLLRVLARGEGERSHGAAMESAEEADEARASADVARELERAFDGLGAGLAEEAHGRLAERRSLRDALAEPDHFLVPEIARDVHELAGRLADGGDHLRMRVAGRAHRDAGAEIEEAVAVDVPHFRAAAMRHHERIVARIGRRDHRLVARNHGTRLGAGQLGLDMGVTMKSPVAGPRGGDAPPWFAHAVRAGFKLILRGRRNGLQGIEEASGQPMAARA